MLNDNGDQDIDVEGQTSFPQKKNSFKGKGLWLGVACALLTLVGLKAVLFHGSMSHISQLHYELTQYIEDHGAKISEAHTGQFPEQSDALTQLVIATKPKIVCEVGFNAGHSAMTFLDADPDLRVYSFDIGEHQYSSLGLKYLQERYSGRITYIKGDSKDKVPEFAHLHHSLDCDMVHIDGSAHDGMTTADILSFEKIAHCSTVLVVDGVRCSDNIGVEWDTLVSKNKVRQLSETVLFRNSCREGETNCAVRCAAWTVAKYTLHCPPL